MITALTPVETKEPVRPALGGGGSPPFTGRDFGGGDSGRGGDDSDSGERMKLGVWIGVIGIVMFFAAIISAMVVRRAGTDWRTLDLPNALSVSTALLLASSAVYELARRGAGIKAVRQGLTASLALGLGFLAAQVVGWRELMDQGIVMGQSASGAFFYLLTAAHGAHVLGGICVLGYATARAWSARPWPTREAVVDATGVYWHFMDALWLVLLVVLVIWG